MGSYTEGNPELVRETIGSALGHVAKSLFRLIELSLQRKVLVLKDRELLLIVHHQHSLIPRETSEVRLPSTHQLQVLNKLALFSSQFR